MNINIKEFVRKIPLLFPLLKIIQDRRYLYHYIQGFITHKRLRKFLSELESKLFYKNKDIDHGSNLDKLDIKMIKEDGFIENPLKIDESQIKEIFEFLKTKPMHDPESKQGDYFYLDNMPNDIKRGFYRCEDVVCAPNVLSIANDPSILLMASKYFNATPSIDYIGSWWSFPSDNLALTQSYHRDIDTLNSLKFFIYLTDVDQESGPFVYIKGSHNSIYKTKKDKMHEDEEIHTLYGEEDIKDLVGKKGHNFIADTYGFHKGLAPTKNNRLVLQIIYTLKRTPFGPKKPFIDFSDAKNLSKFLLSPYTNRHIIRF
tara:strand:+ start:534 stop:1478 length:945 start_codon:yes stop_codon:yes gene_type:complete